MVSDGKIIKNSIFNIVKSLGSLLFPVFTFSYASRIFQADGIGRINFARSIVSVFSMISMLGISLYGIKECTKRRDDRNSLSKTYSELLSINIVSTLFAYVLLFCFVGISVKAGDYKSEIFLLSSGILLGVIGTDWLYTAVEDYRYIATRSLIVQFISLL